jgi:hypothetical protein
MEAHINDQFDHFEHSYNKVTYKANWGSFYGDYINIHDYMGGIKHNKKYKDMPIEDKVAQGLQKL